MKGDEVIKRVEESGKQINDFKENFDTMDAVVGVHLKLTNFPQHEDIQRCLNAKEVFGLSNVKNSIIVFDPETLRIYDYTNSKLVFIVCKDYAQFLNYIKLAVINHRAFFEAPVAIEYLTQKKLLQ